MLSSFLSLNASTETAFVATCTQYQLNRFVATQQCTIAISAILY